MTLFDLLVNWRIDTQHKHELNSKWAEQNINELTNIELLQEISDALEEMKLNKQE